MIRVTWQDLDSGQHGDYEGELPVTIGRQAGNSIVLPSNHVSREHARIEESGSGIVINDLGSRNGIVANGRQVTQLNLRNGTQFRLGPFEFTIHLEEAAADDATVAYDFETIRENEDDTAYFNSPPPPTQQAAQPQQPVQRPVLDKSTIVIDKVEPIDDAVFRTRENKVERFPPGSFYQQVVSVAELRSLGLPIEEVPYLAVGGGMGSFIWVDHLRVFGVKPDQVRAIGFEPKPYGRYRRLCQNSQIPDHERLRSDSGSTPDNVWGWPGYAMREAVTDLGKGKVGHSFAVVRQIFGEPTFSDTYTPISGRVFESVDREAARIGWDQIWKPGRIHAIRKTDDGRYAVAYSAGEISRPGVHSIILAKYIHLAVGYPAIRILSDLQEYRENTGDFHRVVNAYEEHDHVYRELERNGGTVMVRGRGIVASRIIQRLFEARHVNPNIGVLHLMRTPVKEGKHFGRAKRLVKSHWEFQPFNWPKACWGGTLRNKLERATDAERSKLLDQWGGTTTADRVDWQQITRVGLEEGWYDISFGEVQCVEQDPSGKVVTRVKGNANLPPANYVTDYIVDATGLEAGLDSNPLLHDLLTHYGLRRNSKGRLFVTNQFEIEGMRNHDGRMYACGVMTLGGPYAAVDSFLGLQYAALQSVDDLKHNRAPGVRGLNGFRSVRQYLRWTRGAQP
ncbi:MAG: FHA domain-containing protein [Anaerolineae bacterium]|nr:FHA domain-containing protein [Anaerolineae bacterium]